MATFEWQELKGKGRKSYRCGYCDDKVGSEKGWDASLGGAPIMTYIYICPTCTKPTFFDEMERQNPAPRYGQIVEGITKHDIESVYNEARDCTVMGAYTAVVLLCRKILMNIAVDKGADEGKKFKFYVDYLDQKGLIPTTCKDWVDEIREKGNEATHEIPSIEKADAEQILEFVTMLLRIIYEFPSRIKKDDGAKAIT